MIYDLAGLFLGVFFMRGLIPEGPQENSDEEALPGPGDKLERK